MRPRTHRLLALLLALLTAVSASLTLVPTAAAAPLAGNQSTAEATVPDAALPDAEAPDSQTSQSPAPDSPGPERELESARIPITNPSLTVSAPPITLGEDAVITIEAPEAGLGYVDVTVTVDGSPYLITLEDGVGTLHWQPHQPGDYEVEATWDNAGAPVTGRATLTVDRISVELSASVATPRTSTSSGYDLSVSATRDGQPVQDWFEVLVRTTVTAQDGSTRSSVERFTYWHSSTTGRIPLLALPEESVEVEVSLDSASHYRSAPVRLEVPHVKGTSRIDLTLPETSLTRETPELRAQVWVDHPVLGVDVPYTGPATLTVGDHSSTVEVSYGWFTDWLSLPAGTHRVQLSIEATDEHAGASAEKQVVVTRRKAVWDSDTFHWEWDHITHGQETTLYGHLVDESQRWYGSVQSQVPVTLRVDDREVGSFSPSGGWQSLTLPSLDAGTHEFSWSWPGDDDYEPTSGSRSFTVRKAGTYLSSETYSLSTTYGEEAAAELRLDHQDATGEIRWETRWGTTRRSGSIPVVDGVARFSSTDLPVGSQELAFTYSGDDNHAETTTFVWVSVSQAQAVVTVEADSTTYGDTALRISATTSGGEPLDLPIFLWVGPETHRVVLEDGVAVLELPTLAAGDHDVYAYAEVGWDEPYTGYVEKSFKVTPRPQSLSFTTPPSGWVGDARTLDVTSDSGLPVTLALDPTSEACELTDNVLELTGVGDCVVVASQAGDANHLPTDEVTRTITVKQERTSLRLDADQSSATVGDEVQLTATAATAGAPEHAAADRPVDGTVTFVVDGDTHTVSTQDGVADLTLVDLEAGTHEVSATFAPTNAARHGVPEPQQLTVTVAKVDSTVILTGPTAPVTAGDNVTLTATTGSSRGPVEGLVTFLSGDEEVHSVPTSDGVATYTLDQVEAGSHTIGATFTPTNGATHTGATSAPLTVTAAKVGTALTLALDATSVWFGDEVTATLAATADGDPVQGEAQLMVDGDPVTRLTLDGHASVRLTDLAPGGHVVTAEFTPTDARRYSASTAPAVSLAVGEVETSTSMVVAGSTVRVTVTPTTGGAAPRGSVDVLLDGTLVGSVTLVDGEGSLKLTADPAGRTLAAVYRPGVGFLASSGTVSVPARPGAPAAAPAPTITAEVTSRTKRNKAGWYRSPVKVSFTCRTHGVALTKACPKPVTLRDGDAQSVTRSIRTVAGGVATTTVAGLRVDTSAPRLRLGGLAKIRATRHATPPAAPRCVASDRTSGVASCTVRTVRKGSRVTWRAKAVDRAGNVTTTRASIRLAKALVAGAKVRDEVTQVRSGRAYTFEVRSKSQPRYLLAAPSPQQPRVLAQRLTKVGRDRWAITVRFEKAMANGRTWLIGVRAGSRTLTVPVRVTR